MNKFNIGQPIYVLNIGYKTPFVVDFLVHGISKQENGIFYTENNYAWVSEDSLFKTKKEAYDYVINQCKNEINNPKEGI